MNGKLKRLIRRAFGRIESVILGLRIARKWKADAVALPLTPAHWELYEIIHRLCWRELRDFPNLVNCRDFNDRIQWLKLFDQDRRMIQCSDKIQVRDFIRNRVGEQYLVELYQVHDHFGQIDFDTLPKSFVIKVNHDSGTVILVRDKARFDPASVEKRVVAALRRPYGWLNGEWAYSYVRPRVMVEEFIEPDRNGVPPDYKFYVLNGEAKFCHFIYDRATDPKEQLVDRFGRDMATDLHQAFGRGDGFRKPVMWEEMIRVAEQVGSGFKCVRVDLYATPDRLYVGEMTFWPMAGCYKGSGQKALGALLDFDRTTFLPFLLPELDREVGLARSWA